MPTAKRRITMTLTGQIERDLEIIWSVYPNLRDNAIETISFVLTLRASEIATGIASALPKPEQPLVDVPPDQEPATDGEDDWTD
ncbi:MAG: hypothetical protein KME10_24840 [Plectolyngbya sp. WJT66-NPBG17]|jgi:hypothetical protein|nr:hypothetical protein [Plectolyngbya sp. WJT66-NPBG17]